MPQPVRAGHPGAGPRQTRGRGHTARAGRRKRGAGVGLPGWGQGETRWAGRPRYKGWSGTWRQLCVSVLSSSGAVGFESLGRGWRGGTGVGWGGQALKQTGLRCAWTLHPTTVRIWTSRCSAARPTGGSSSAVPWRASLCPTCPCSLSSSGFLGAGVGVLDGPLGPGPSL